MFPTRVTNPEDGITTKIVFLSELTSRVVGQHKNAMWDTEPGDSKCGHGSIEGGRALTLGG